jgi:hypothetical protein
MEPENIALVTSAYSSVKGRNSVSEFQQERDAATVDRPLLFPGEDPRYLIGITGAVAEGLTLIKGEDIYLTEPLWQ